MRVSEMLARTVQVALDSATLRKNTFKLNELVAKPRPIQPQQEPTPRQYDMTLQVIVKSIERR